MTNWRAKVEVDLGEEVADPVWDLAEQWGYVEDVTLGRMTVTELSAKIRKLYAVLDVPVTGPEIDQPGKAGFPQASEATSARIDAISAIYAAWASSEPEVHRFRNRILARTCAAMGMPTGADGLLAGDQVSRWVRWCLEADADGGNPDGYILGLVAAQAAHGPRPIADLWYIAEGQERAQGVDVHGSLGQLAKLAETLAERYRWRPSEATMLLLTGRMPEVQVYTGSAEIRYNYMSASTRVTMTLDPALSPDEVAGIYERLRRRFHAGTPPRNQAVRRHRLAGHVGPHVQMRSGTPDSRTGPGRRPSPNPSGLALFIEPASGHTWESLRGDWNRLQRNQVGENWEYASASNFIRDAKTALIRLLFPGWISRP